MLDIDRFSAFTALSRGLFWAADAGILMVWGYHDESGEYDTSGGLVNMTVAGCYSPLDRWQSLDQDWKVALDAEGLDAFHMADFEAWRPPFDFCLADGSRDKARHNRLLNSLLDLMLEHVDAFYGFGAGSPISEDRKRQHRLSMEDCMAGAIGGAVNTAWERYQKPLNLVFAKQEHFPIDGIRKFIRLYDYEDGKGRIESDSYALASKVRPLQAADILAYEVARAQRSGREERYPFIRLRNGAKERGVPFTVSWKVRSSLAF